MAKPDKPQEKPDPAAARQILAPCYIRDQPSGGLSITFQVSPEIAARLKSRGGSMDLARYVYENILKGAIAGHVY